MGCSKAAPPGFLWEARRALASLAVRSKSGPSSVIQRSRSTLWFLLHLSGERDVVWAFGQTGLNEAQERGGELGLQSYDR